MEKYKIELTRAAERELTKLTKRNKSAAKAIADGIRGLAENPRPRGIEKLTDTDDDKYRIRVGNHRIIFEIHDNEILVVVIRISNRKDAYRALRR